MTSYEVIISKRAQKQLVKLSVLIREKIAEHESEEPGKYGDPVGKQIIGVVSNATKLKTRIRKWSITTVKQLQKRFEAAVSATVTTYVSEPLGDGADARYLAHRTGLSGEAALEFC